MEVISFAEIEAEFIERAHRAVWCNVATVDTRGRPRSRILHPVWEGQVGWIGTRPTSHKAKHLAGNPYVSLVYIADVAKPVYVDCRAEWVDDLAEKRRVWEFIKNAAPPVGYDPATIFPHAEDPGFGVLKLLPWRIELATMPNGRRVWHAPMNSVVP